MKKFIYSLMLCSMMLIPTVARAQSEEGFTIAGKVSFPKSGNVFIELLTEEEFDRDHQAHGEEEQNSEPVEAKFHAILNVGEQELQQKKVSFTFEHVPAGTYGIMCYQDVNGNGQLDEGMFGPKEPWGSYRHKRPKFRGPKFEEIAFEIDTDIADITFEVE